MPIFIRHPDNLRTVAREVRELTTGLVVPEYSAEEMLAYTAGARLKALSRMAEEMSDLLIHRLTGPISTDRAELRGNTALATATAGCAQAMGSLAEVLQQVAFLNEHAHRPPSTDLSDARGAAWNVIHDRMDEARAALYDTADQLECDARRLVPPPRRPATSAPQAQRPPAPAPVSSAVRRQAAL
ncbi:hypothetical protein WEB32_30325 [Streptomyces netropsis]|uniref:hypothetical protein n=1 Tax=Streptomyces netropsis TaxID=55404 RepID=UPI0030D55281